MVAHAKGQKGISPRTAEFRVDRTSQNVGTPRVEIAKYIKWARAIARGVRSDYHFVQGSQDELDLEATAYLALVKKAISFDPSRLAGIPNANIDGAFRGYAAVYIRSEVRREASRLRNGGMYWTRREIPGQVFTVLPLSTQLSPEGTPVDVIDPRSLRE